MLHTVPRSSDNASHSVWIASAFPRSSAADLVAGARRALDHDVEDVRHFLDRLTAMFDGDGGIEVAERMLLPSVPVVAATSEPVKGGLAAWQLRNVVRLVEDGLGETITLAALAKEARLSQGHFCRAFKVTIGETPHTFLIRRRVRRAQMLMLRTEDTLSQIASECGLSDQAHLTRLFRKMVGMTPTTWRRIWQQVAVVGTRAA